MKEVVCTHCGKAVYKIIAPIRAGDMITSAPFKGINGHPDPKDGDEILCPACNENLKPGLALATGLSIE